MRIRKRKNKKKKTVNGFASPAPLVGGVIVVVLFAIAYICLEYKGEILGDDILKLSKKREELKKRYVNEECRWMEEKSLANIKSALRRYNIEMDWPVSRQVVHVNVPKAHKQSIASLERNAKGYRLAGTVMND